MGHEERTGAQVTEAIHKAVNFILDFEGIHGIYTTIVLCEP
jgi:hypothetical protein